MKNRALNVFILNDDAPTAGKLRKYLKEKFKDRVRISLFFSSRSCMNMLDNHVDLVVVDDYLNGDVNTGTPGVEVLKQIKAVQPSTEVIILASNEDVSLKIDALHSGARDYILNKKGAWHSLRVILDQTIHQPIRFLVSEFGVKVYVMVFIGWFLLLGLITWIGLKFWRNDLV